MEFHCLQSVGVPLLERTAKRVGLRKPKVLPVAAFMATWIVNWGICSSPAFAGPFQFEKQYAHGELDPSFTITNYTCPDDRTARDVEISLCLVNRGNPEFPGYGELDEWMPDTEIGAEYKPNSLEVVMRGNPVYRWGDVWGRST